MLILCLCRWVRVRHHGYDLQTSGVPISHDVTLRGHTRSRTGDYLGRLSTYTKSVLQYVVFHNYPNLVFLFLFSISIGRLFYYAIIQNSQHPLTLQPAQLQSAGPYKECIVKKGIYLSISILNMHSTSETS